MNTIRPSQRPGLILLVVLGMLALFSMLAVTYVVFASQSRATSVSLSRRDVRGNQSYKPLFDEAIKQLIRGSTDNTSATYGHSLLGDVYGDRESFITGTPATVPAARQATLLRIRNVEFIQNNLNTQPLAYFSLQRPMLLGPSIVGTQAFNGHYLRIPLEPGNYNNPTLLPVEHDVLNGRVITFPEGNGPLSGLSFRIVRYVGRVDPALNTADDFAQNYSITIDLMEADLSQIFAKYDVGTGVLRSLSLAEWANAFPPSTTQSQAGVYLCFNNVDDTAPNLLRDPFNVLLNAVPLNSHGVGVASNGATQFHVIPPGATPMHAVATGLQPNYRQVETLPGSMNVLGINTPGLIGDSDEPYDAPDYANFFLAHRLENATTPGQIIPSFHRAALINYLVNWKDPATYTPDELLLTLRRIQGASGRPLSINVITPAGNLVSQPGFTGSNHGAAIGGVTFASTLNINIPSNWSGSWATPNGLGQFLNWVNWLTAGPWDVDNDSDGLTDSVWVDVGLPLQTSTDGKLLKALVAYYVDDLDSNLDVNATASMAQTGVLPGINNNVPYDTQPDGEFARFAGANSLFFAQGLGYGSAENSFRHLFFRTFGNTPAAAAAFQQFLMARYGRNSFTLDRSPGLGPFVLNNLANMFEGDDAVSQLRMREQRNIFNHATLPGLPLGTHGRVSVALDRLGNPRVWNLDNFWQQSVEEPYEARWLSAAHQDSPVTFAEWERLYRIGDSDRMGLPQRLETLFGETPSSAPASNLRHEITPRSSHLRVPLMGTRHVLNPADVTWQPTSFIELVNAILISRNLITTPIQLLDRINYRGFASLFPLEFERGLPLDLNRALGNGVDDDNDGELDEPVEIANVVQNALYATGQRTTGPTNPAVAEDYIQNQLPLTLDSPAKQPYDLNVLYAGNPQTLGFFQRNLESRQLLARHLYCLAQLVIPQNYRFPNSDPNLNYTLPLARATKLARAKILAQWAVNVVDFRDADSSMTRFPYDPFPFDVKEGGFYAWDPNPRAIDSTDTTLQNLRTVVWGMEQPELLMTESLATHDVRIKRNDTANPPRYDQYRIPQGSLFLEFFCPRITAQNGNQQAAGVSPALYNANNPVALDLTRMAPGRPASASVTVPASSPDPGVPPVPVWRVYISGPIPSTVPAPATPLEVYNDPSRKNQLSYQMINANLRYDSAGSPVDGAQERARNAGFVFDSTQTNPIPEPDPAEARVLVFTPKAAFTPSVDNCPGVVDPEAQVFVSETAGAVLTGGQYLVVGPRPTTFFGSRTTAFDDPFNPVNHPNPHRIELVAGWTRMYKTDNSLVNQRANMNNCFTVVASSLAPPAWRTGNTRLPQGIGLNVSEPLANDSDYYREPTDVVNMMDTATDPQTSEPGFGSQTFDDAYADYNAGTPGPLPPFDDQQSTRGPLQHWRAGNNTNITSEQVVAVGTQQNWCTAYLQRLADPEKPWDATFNPYITVDWMPIDLTVFSGEEDHSDVYPASPPQGQELRFASRQKTGQPLQRIGPASFAYDFTSPTVPLGTTLYSAATHAPREVAPLGLTTGFFDYELAMDEVAGTAAAPIRPTLVNLLPTSDANHVNNTFATLGFLNSTYRIAGEEGSVATSAVRGLPADPTNGVTANVQPNINWLPDSLYWANRQFTSPLEMTTVPLSSPGQFMQEFSAVDPVGTSRYEVADSGNAQLPFNHLLPFTYEQSQRPPIALANLPEIPVSAFFNLVETASPWSDAHKYADPRELAFRNPSSVPAVVAQNVAASNYVLQPLRAPYNRISRYVEPGRINLNTVAERNVLQGLFFNALQPNERTILNSTTMNNLWTQFQFSRQGYTGGGGAYVSPALPIGARFNPEVPTEFARPFKPAMESGMVPLTRAAQAGNPNTLDPDGYHTPANATLLRSDPNQNTLPLLRESYPFAQKNAFTDAHPITRLGNLSTERSNVFGVYVTVGLFEYDPGTGVIGQEFGEDKGQAQRYKAFYVIDRSIPVGFQTGVDHNVEKTILLRRYLKTDDR